MVDQLSSVDTCIACGAPLKANREAGDNFCENCLALQPVTGVEQTAGEAALAAEPYGDFYASPALQPGERQPEESLDPDRPPWGPVTGLGLWMFSVASIIVVPVVAVIAWYFLDMQRGIPVPTYQDRVAFLEYLQSPRLLIVQVYSTMIAHLVTLGFCWLVVTSLKKRPFLRSLGWDWAGRSPLYWVLFSAAVVISVIVADVIFKLFLPQAETPFEKLLSSSYHIKVAVAVLATFSAPFVEEIIYRGVLYSGLRKYFGVPATIFIVTVLFAGVHVPQYLGAWASLSGLMLLSLILTIVRAKTRSLLPCITIHFVNNGFISLFLVFGKQ
jgi:membrane protease YdiL (CAAX protease family)